MLDRFKDIGNQVANRANEAVGDLSTSVRDGVGNLNDKAVRAAAAQMCAALEAALAEVKTRPLAAHPVVLTASVNVGITALQMQVHCGSTGAVPGDAPSRVTPGDAPTA